MSDIDEMTVIKVLADAVAAPGAATHAQGKVERVIKATTITEGMRLVDQYTYYIDFLDRKSVV